MKIMDQQTADIRESLVQLVNESLESARRRERTAFDKLTSNTSGIVLFGAGGLGRKALAALRKDGIDPLAFIDNKLTGYIDGVPVCSLQEGAVKWGSSASFVVTIWSSWSDGFREQSDALKNLGCRNVLSFIPLLWKHPDLLPHVQVDLPSKVLEQRRDVLSAFELCADEQSAREYLAQLRWRLFGDFESLGAPVPDQYFQTDLFHLGKDAVFVDAGAFDGDTLAQFARFTGGEFKLAYLFEPDELNLRAIERRLTSMSDSSRTRVRVFGSAVSDHQHYAAFMGGLGASSTVGIGSGQVLCIALDDLLSEPPDLIKFDIEGAELSGIRGARRTIAERAPNLAICAYHTQSHLWEIPLLVNSINPNYRFFLRPHGQIWETVWYAIPPRKDG